MLSTPWLDRPIKEKLLLGFITPILLMVGVSVAVFNNTKYLVNHSKWVEHTHKVIASTRELLLLMVDMETGERGFLITGNDSFLEPFNNSLNSWQHKHANLQRLISDNPQQVELLVKIGALQQQWLEKAANVQIAAKRQSIVHDSALTKTPTIEPNSLDDVTRLITSQVGINIMDEIRTLTAEFIFNEENLVVLRSSLAKKSVTNTYLLIILGTIIAVLLGLFIATGVSNSISKRLNVLLKRTEKVALGDYLLDETPNDMSKDEIGKLNNAFSKMTHSLATEAIRVEKHSQQLIESRHQAEQAVRAKSEFLASMSHEIRTPMNGVLGMLGLLKNSDLNRDQQHRVAIAKSSALSLLTLINDILDFSKIEAGKLDLESLDFDLRGVLGEIAEVMGLQAQAKDLELIMDVTRVEESSVNGDPGRLRQIITNIISNAIKFTSVGEIVIRAELSSTNDDYCRLICSVSDTGIGIPPEKISSLFESFSQVDASTTRKFGGTGLGLSIVEQLCKLMNGEINVLSTQAEGSCFTIDIQLNKNMESQKVTPTIDMHRLHLLVVDDNTANGQALRNQLEHWGATVTIAESGHSAIQICEQRIHDHPNDFFDIAFLDMQMPSMGGTELGKTLNADPRFEAMKLVMMTSMGYQSDTGFFKSLGFSGYFPKPATTSDLLDALSVIAKDDDPLEQALPTVKKHNIHTLPDDYDADTGRVNALTHLRVLLVDDNQINQLVAMGILNELGVQLVDVAANGKEALNYLRDTKKPNYYTLIFMDCQMPEMDGYETTKLIREGKTGEYNKSIPIVAMTANAMQGDKEKCLLAGMNDYIPKPVEPEMLLAKLIHWMPVIKKN